MSFWESIRNKETVVLSDDAIDLLSDVLLEIKKIYQEDLERMPTVAEWEALIMEAMQLDSNIAEQLEEMEITDVKFKLKKRKKDLNIEPGIVFAIPLKEIEKYAYGLVVKGKGLKDDIYINCNFVLRSIVRSSCHRASLSVDKDETWRSEILYYNLYIYNISISSLMKY
ncbi:hypothetical protein ACWNXI_04180 [Caldibacillus thermoamylovorans]